MLRLSNEAVRRIASCMKKAKGMNESTTELYNNLMTLKIPRVEGGPALPAIQVLSADAFVGGDALKESLLANSDPQISSLFDYIPTEEVDWNLLAEVLVYDVDMGLFGGFERGLYDEDDVEEEDSLGDKMKYPEMFGDTMRNINRN